MNEYNVINSPKIKGSDWNANEGENGYIKNRTHYTETVENNIEWTFNLPESQGETYIDPGNQEVCNQIYEVYLADKDYAERMTLFLHKPILINGTERDCYFFYFKDSTKSMMYLMSIDDISLIVKDAPKYTYLTFTQSNNNLSLSYFTSWFNVGVNTIKIPYITENVVKLDPKYLPEIKSLSNIKDAENGGIIEGLVQVNIASGQYAHAEGNFTSASGATSHAEGNSTNASGQYSHAEGDSANAKEYASHAEGIRTSALGYCSHAEGSNSNAMGGYSHAEGDTTVAFGEASHAEGCSTVANHAYQHVFGEYNIADPSTAQKNARGNYVEIVGNGVGARSKSNARTLDWNGNEVLAGKLTVGTQPTQDNDVATKKYVDENSGGLNNIKDAENGGVIEGLVNGEAGQVNVASGKNAHVEGGVIYGDSETGTIFAYGINQATGDGSHAEGDETKASGQASHAEGGITTASRYASHAEGERTTASGQASHAEGGNTTASGYYSHAEGGNTTASGKYAHAEGDSTTANHKSQHVFGDFNVEDPSTALATARGNYVEIVGNGTSSAKSNARTLDWNGNEWISGTMRAENGFILISPDGSLFTLTVANDGTLTATKNA